ncbi:MAG: hypothetical protein JW723_08460 [Bacteroidales bacterium]|nr:hypothetical protein [Bacteroidales bacterium]
MKPSLTAQSVLLFFIMSVIVLVTGCGGLKDAQERRNLMIPKKDELPRNKKYKMVEKRKTYKLKKKYKKRK